MLRAALLAIAVAAFGTGALASDLIVALPNDSLGRALNDAFVTPFAHATGLVVAAVMTDGSVAAARAARADLAALAEGPLAAGCRDGSLMKLDWNALGGRDRQMAGTPADCGLGAAMRGTVLAWNRSKFSGTPVWGDFWDIAKVPGKRGLHRGARMNLELALMADGVPAGDVYATLRSDGGVDRAFRKLDQLKPYLVWWQGDDEAAKLLESGDVLMTSAPAERIVAAQRGSGGVPAQPSLALQWAGCLITVDRWAILAGAKQTAAASRFLTYVADPKNQKLLPTAGAFGAAANGANDGLPANVLANSPSAPQNLQGALMIDEQFWIDNGVKLDRLFEAWISK
jgi:putative spermidine/putrescine transport system substrate-binding protein